jgi:hypothetical protein
LDRLLIDGLETLLPLSLPTLPPNSLFFAPGQN